MKRYKTPDDFYQDVPNHRKEVNLLREIILKTPVVETVKWGFPVYTVNNKNVIGIGSFKSYFGLWFHQGSFLNDPYKVLINAQEGVTKGMRQWRFDNADDIDEGKILEYINEAIENQKNGLEIKAEKKKLVIPDILQNALDLDQVLKQKFEEFSPGKKKEFANYINEAKREETKNKRLEKISPMIKDGIGLNDKYRRN